MDNNSAKYNIKKNIFLIRENLNNRNYLLSVPCNEINMKLRETTKPENNNTKTNLAKTLG